MAGLLGYLVAGAAEGTGESLKAQALARREERLRKLDQDFMLRRDEAQRAFQSSENDKNRAADIDRGGDVIQMEDKSYGVRRGNKVEPLIGPDGKPAKVATATDTSKMPADAQMVEYLVNSGVFPNRKAAWDATKRSVSDPNKTRADIYKGWLDVLTKNSFGNVDAGKVAEEAQRRTEETMVYLEGPKPDAPSSAALAETGTGKGDRVTSFPPAPRDPAARKAGQVYSAPDGRKGRWTGSGWEIVE